jgi:hypothetical protein
MGHQTQGEMMKAKANELEKYLRRHLLWTRTSDPTFPWRAMLKRVNCRLRINDFPQEAMYTLLVDGQEAGDFDDWPACWKKDERTDGAGSVGKPKAAAAK